MLTTQAQRGFDSTWEQNALDAKQPVKASSSQIGNRKHKPQNQKVIFKQCTQLTSSFSFFLLHKNKKCSTVASQ